MNTPGSAWEKVFYSTLLGMDFFLFVFYGMPILSYFEFVDSETPGALMMAAVLAGWPIFVILVILAAISGTVILVSGARPVKLRVLLWVGIVVWALILKDMLPVQIKIVLGVIALGSAILLPVWWLLHSGERDDESFSP